MMPTLDSCTKKGIARESLFGSLVDLHPNVLGVKLDGATKEDYVWGFRVGFITFGFKGANAAQLKALENKAAGAVRGTISNAPCVSQAILLKAYTAPEYAAQKKQKYGILADRVQKIRATLKAHPEYAQSFEVMPFNSGYFMCVQADRCRQRGVAQGADCQLQHRGYCAFGLDTTGFFGSAHRSDREPFCQSSLRQFRSCGNNRQVWDASSLNNPWHDLQGPLLIDCGDKL